jgi:uracil-DNA glycosylase
MSASDPRETQLQAVQERISQCRICAELVDDLQQPARMNRGSVARVMIVGEGPGRTELTEER